MRISIVDDCLESRLLLKTFLIGAGYRELQLAVSALEALQILHEPEGKGPEIDLILRDVRMPDMDGSEARRRAPQALDRDDFSRISALGHTLSGMGGSYGLPVITKVGRALEAAARSRNLDEARAEIERRCDYVERLEVTG